MSDKISKRLNMGERFFLLAKLPAPDYVTYKILRKLKETLSPSEKEIKDYGFKNSFRCPHREYDKDGKAFQCEVEETTTEIPTCPIHNEPMQPIGLVAWNPEMWNKTKEIWFGMKANSIIVEALKTANEEDRKANGDLVSSLYDKFLSEPEEEEE